MKIELHIPVEQYGFVSIVTEDTDPSETRDLYARYAEAFKDGMGVADKDFNALLDQYLTTKTVVNGQEVYERMNGAQKAIIQALKRSYKRIGK